eukprot:scaffold273796_cov31-Tisochrysis_lutea.AAC.11
MPTTVQGGRQRGARALLPGGVGAAIGGSAAGEALGAWGAGACEALDGWDAAAALGASRSRGTESSEVFRGFFLADDLRAGAGAAVPASGPEVSAEAGSGTALRPRRGTGTGSAAGAEPTSR